MTLSADEQIKAIQDIQTIIGKEPQLYPAPPWPEQAAWPLLGLMAYEEKRPKFVLDETGSHVIGLNLANLGIDDDKWDQVQKVIDPALLRALNLSDNQLTRFTTEGLPRLETLNLNGNGALTAFSFPATGLQHIVRAELNECAFAELVVPAGMSALQALNVRFGKLARLVFAGDCPALEVLDLRDNQLAELKLPANLPRLWYFNADKNKLLALEIPGPLPELTTLYIRDNQLEQLDPLNLLQHTKLDALYIHGNPWKLNQALLPESREKNSIRAIKSLLEERKKGEKINDRVKIILVGNGRVGKTSLYRRLRNEPLNPNEPYTHGLSIGLLDEKEFIPEVSTDSLHASVWDFGGQEIFYATHQFFLTEGALYILCWNKEEFVKKYRDQNDEDRPYDGIWRDEYYWLENIRLQGKDSPVLLVQTHCDQGNLPLSENIDKKYTADALRFSAEEEYKSTLEDLRREMAKKINKAIPDFGQKFASNYDRLIDAIAERKKEDTFISLDTFREIATNPEIDISNVDSALEFLRRSGIVVYYPDNDHLKDVVYIDPNWLTETVYKIFKNDLLETEGRFDQAYLAKVLPEPKYTALDRERFVALLLQFELVFKEKRKEKNTGFFVAPQYLPEQLTQKEKRTLDDKFEMQELCYVFKFSKFLPDNVIVNFLSRYGAYAEELIWKKGICFKHVHNRTVDWTVILDEAEKKLKVYATKGIKNSELERKFIDEFDALSKGAYAEISLDGVRFVSWRKLLEKYTNRNSEIEDTDGKTMPLSAFYHLLEPVSYRPDGVHVELSAETSQTEIFFSYARGADEETGESREKIVNELYTELLNDAYNVQRDKISIKYGDLISVFMERIGKGKLVVVFISNKYLKSKYCMYELYELYRNCRFDKEAFVKRVLPVRVENVELAEVDTRRMIVKHWNDEFEKIEKFHDDYPQDIGEAELKERAKIRSIKHHASEMMMLIADINAETLPLLRKDDFSIVKNAIEKRVNDQS